MYGAGWASDSALRGPCARLGCRMDVIVMIEESVRTGQSRGMPRAIRTALLWFAALAAILASGPSVDAQTRPLAFVDVATVIPGLVVDMRYFGTHNFVVRPDRAA